MTFVRALILEAGPTLLGDWLVTDPGTLGRPSYANGVLKVLRLNRGLTVAYAGNVELCLRATSEAARRFESAGFEAGLDILARCSAKDDAEFVVAALHPARLFEVKRGDLRSTGSAWLGQQEAFEQYQIAFDGEMRSNGDPQAALNRAFETVVRAGKVDGVGLTAIRVNPEAQGFEYAPSMYATPGFTPQQIPSDTLTTISWGDAGDGGFAESVMGSSKGAGVGIYFAHGKHGVLSAPLSGPHAATIKAQTQADFVREVKLQYGIQLLPGIELK